jgi:hypothetical protein
MMREERLSVLKDNEDYCTKEEEKRKTTQYESEMSKRRAEYQAQLEL